MNPQFVQIPCVKCGATVWISPAAGVGYCPSCHTPNSMPAGGAPQAQAAAPQGQAAFAATMVAPSGGAPGYGQPQGQQQQWGQQPQGQQQWGQQAQQPAAQQPAAQAPQAGQPQQPMVHPMMAGYRQPKKPPVALIGAGVVVAIVASIGWTVVRPMIFKKPGHASVKDVGVSDAKKADLDKLITGTKTLAQKWRANAQFFSVTANGVNPDGTVDLTDGNVIVKYISVGNKKDSMKEFIFNGDDVTYDKVWDTTRAWEADDVTPVPECNAAKLAKALKKEGWKSGKAQFIINPEDTDKPAWHVNATGVTDFFDLETCDKLKVEFSDK